MKTDIKAGERMQIMVLAPHGMRGEKHVICAHACHHPRFGEIGSGKFKSFNHGALLLAG
jgi:hypothetical protein